jgi:hypothetical protein
MPYKWQLRVRLHTKTKVDKAFSPIFNKGGENALNIKPTVSTATLVRVGYPELLQDIFQQTPFGQGRLQQVGPDKCGKPKPVDIHINGQDQTDQYKGSGYSSYNSISHFKYFKRFFQ